MTPTQPDRRPLPAAPPEREPSPRLPIRVRQGRSGEGLDSVLPALREQEERRKPLSDQ